MRTLEKLTIKNFKSIRDQTLALGALNIFIGGNGAGKSNLIQAFRFLRDLVNQRLREYAVLKGGADKILYFGRKRSPEMSMVLKFAEGGTANVYDVKLQGAENDMLVIAQERVLYGDRDNRPELFEEYVSSYSNESKLKNVNNDCARQALRDIDSFRVYHFHDTSDMAEVKRAAKVEDNRALKPQAENLAAVLYWMQEKRPDHFANIEGAIRQIAPFFDEFRLEPSKLNESNIRLEWREKGSDDYFDATSFSDGTLRFICLVTLLLQPDLPPAVLLDEPELGLHPAAIAILADLLSSAATRAQIIVATQSATLVNHFSPESIWTVDREDNQSVFRHLAGADMTAWLDDYALGELWEKNVLGARP